MRAIAPPCLGREVNRAAACRAGFPQAGRARGPVVLLRAGEPTALPTAPGRLRRGIPDGIRHHLALCTAPQI